MELLESQEAERPAGAKKRARGRPRKQVNLQAKPKKVNPPHPPACLDANCLHQTTLEPFPHLLGPGSDCARQTTEKAEEGGQQH